MNAEPDRADEEVAASEEVETTANGNDEVVDELAELQAKAEENWDKYLRAAAELENVRKRATRDVEHAHRFAIERFATDLLAVCDSLEMAVVAEGDSAADSLKEGSEATLKLLLTTMQRFGIEQLDPVGEPFDPTHHEAITMQPAADAEPGSVLTVFQKGYALNGRLLRPARVVVASEPVE
ncbi:MAG: nucleotide exchange factor GrpE [Gammaproteobacteria bacterium]|nr:nucleotide exchange factor GrpE [Gammaproteobacteria bacterium]